MLGSRECSDCQLGRDPIASPGIPWRNFTSIAPTSRQKCLRIFRDPPHLCTLFAVCPRLYSYSYRSHFECVKSIIIRYDFLYFSNQDNQMSNVRTQLLQLHRTLPNLKDIHITSAGKHTREIFMLPDMSGLKHVRETSLRGKFHFPKDLEDGASFPSCICKLSIWVRNPKPASK